MYEDRESFKSMLYDFTYHHKTNKVSVHTFIKVLYLYLKILLDSTVDRQALEKNYDELYMLLDHIS